VAYSVNKNTAALQTTNENFLYEVQFARNQNVVSVPGLALIYAKSEQNEPLSEDEAARFYRDKMQDLSSWEFAFTRHRDGMFAPDQWVGWDNYFEVTFVTQIPEDTWLKVRHYYAEDFRSHVDAAYARK
jgi:hypothetical protein